MISYYTCSLENTFSAKLLMHMFFAGFALHLLVIVAAYISPNLTDKPNECTALGILIHYFLLAHFSWIFVQVIFLFQFSSVVTFSLRCCCSHDFDNWYFYL